MNLNLQSYLLNQEIIQKKFNELKDYSIMPTYGFASGCSVQINKEAYMLHHIPYSNKIMLKKPELIKINDTYSFYDYHKYTSIKEFIFKDFKDLIKKIDKWFIEKSCSKTDGNGNIYLVTDGEFTKIGATTYNIEKRLIELQTGNPKKLDIIGFYPVENKLSTEKFIHNEFKEKNILNEWFRLSYDDIKTILMEKPSVKRKSMYQGIEDIDIDNIRYSLYANYKEYDEIINKKIKRKLKKIENFKNLINGIFDKEGAL